MGFFDALVSAGKSAGQAMGDAVTKKQLEMWEKMRRSPPDRLLDFYKQNKTQERDNASNRALALAALSSESLSKAKDLLKNDDEAKNRLVRLREKISLETDYKVQELRDNIDRLIG